MINELYANVTAVQQYMQFVETLGAIYLKRIRPDYSIMFFLLSTNPIDKTKTNSALVCLLKISDFPNLWHSASSPFVPTEHTSL